MREDIVVVGSPEKGASGHLQYVPWWTNPSLVQPMCTLVDGSIPRYCDFQQASCRLPSQLPQEIDRTVGEALLKDPYCRAVNRAIAPWADQGCAD